MTEYKFELKVDLLRNIPFLLDAVLEIGIGIIMVTRLKPETMMLIIGSGFLTIGIIEVLRKVKTFHLTNAELIIKRPLFPFSLAEHRFQIFKLKEIKFIRVKGRFGGRHLNIVTADQAESYRIEAGRDKIDEFEIKLISLGISPIRVGMWI
jgi:hypothetical protein